MAWSYVAAGTTTIGNTAITVPMPAGIASGDYLILVVNSQASAAPTPVGWTVIQSQYSRPFAYILYRVATGTDPSVVVTTGVNNIAGVVVAYRGLASVGNTSATTTLSTASLTSTAGALVLSVFNNESNPATWGAPAGTTTRVTLNSTAAILGFLIVDETQASAGATTVRTATNSSGTYDTYAVSFAIPPTATGKFFFLF